MPAPLTGRTQILEFDSAAIEVTTARNLRFALPPLSPTHTLQTTDEIARIEGVIFAVNSDRPRVHAPARSRSITM